MGKNDLKSKVKNAGNDAVRTSLFGSLDDYESASAGKKAPDESNTSAAETVSNETPASEITQPASTKVETTKKAPVKTEEPKTEAIETAEDEEENIFETYTRKTYFYNLPQIEAIRIMSFKSGLDISQTVRDLMDQAIPPEIMEEAIEKVKAGNIKKPQKRKKK